MADIGAYTAAATNGSGGAGKGRQGELDSATEATWILLSVSL